jgi:hypothetical protein
MKIFIFILGCIVGFCLGIGIVETLIINLIKFVKSKTLRSYIEYDNTNNMHNDGHIRVYVKGKLVESIFVDEYKEENEDIYSAYEIIDLMKLKYKITRVIVKEGYNWR